MFKELAKEIGLNANGFETCLNSGKYQAAIKEDIAEGNRVGVSGTPAFFINGRLIPALSRWRLSRELSMTN